MKPNKSSGKPGSAPAKPSPSQASPDVTQERIAERARQIWMDRGQPEGKDMEHWLEAERQLRGANKAGQDAGLTDRDIETDKNVDGLVQRPR
jgi:hypothetical protein